MALITLLPAGKKIKVASHQTIAAALRQAGYCFDEQCTHDAHCEGGQISIIDGADHIDYGEFKDSLLPLLREENIVKACLAYLKGNVILEADLTPSPRKTKVYKRSPLGQQDVSWAQTSPAMDGSATTTTTTSSSSSSSSSISSSSSSPAWYRFWEKDAMRPRPRGGGRRARFFKFTPSSDCPRTQDSSKS